MNYTARYVEFPVIIIYRLDRDSELDEDSVPLGEASLVESFIRLRPLDIEGYSPDTNGEFPTSADQLNCTRVYMKGGAEHIINMPINDFEGYLDEMYKKING